MSSPSSLLRPRAGHEAGRVGMVELFFDLVFVFAVTQLSHALLADLGAAGFVRAGLLLVAMWWVWIYTTWAMNWLDPERLPVRLCLFALMLAGLVFSASITAAFAGRGLALALAYVAMQVGRSLFVVWALRGEARNLRINFLRILVWLALAGVAWICGGLADGSARFGWWTAALAIEIAGPALYFHVPGLGRSSIADWDIQGAHMAERCGLFVIIALGESLLVTGATFAQLEWTAATVAAFASASVGAIAMWWIYFDSGAEHALKRILASADPGRQGRLAYTYTHAVIVAGIIVCAVADELALSHPGHGSDVAARVIVAGPFVFLLGTALFKWVTHDRRLPPLSHLAGLVVLAAMALPAAIHAASPLLLSLATTAVLLAVAAWEWRVLPRARGAAAD